MPRINLDRVFSVHIAHGLELEKQGFRHPEAAEKLNMHPTMYSRGKRIYLTAIGEHRHSGILAIRECAQKLVKLLDEEEISISYAEERLIESLRINTGTSTQRRHNATTHPNYQLKSYRRALASLEGVCLGLERFPDTISPNITAEQREEIVTRLAKCRTSLERRINTIRRDTSAEA